MNDSGGLDIGRVIGMIMENPELVAQIAAMAKSSPTPSPSDANVTEEVKVQKEEVPTVSPATIPADTYPQQSTAKFNRTQLLGALKPYVSEERAKAIDSMLTIADILDMMKAR